MQRLLSWIKTHPLNFFLLAIIAVLLTRPFDSLRGVMTRNSYSTGIASPAMESMDYKGAADSYTLKEISPILPPGMENSTDVTASPEQRMVVTNSHVSLLVQDVRDSVRKINSFVSSQGGFTVNSSVNEPEHGATAHISIRVPIDKLDTTLEHFRSLAVRVISEDVSGHDVTDQYQDLDARLQTLQQTKQKFEEIYRQAQTVEEILHVQRSILDVQTQIDGIKGQMEYLKNTANSTLITAYLATDELALPYAPAQPWRPQAIFKEAVRSLVGNLRGIGSLAIWAIVYSPIIIAVGAVLWSAHRWHKRQTV